MMRFLLAILMALMVCSPVLAQDETPPPPDALITALDEAAKDSRFSSAALTILHEDGTQTIRTFGIADNETNTLPKDETPYLIASITKTMTALSVMQLVDTGQIDLDSPANTYLNGLDLPDGKTRPISVRDLLTHRSGLGALSYGVIRRETLDAPVDASFVKRHLPPLVREPGTDVVYSNMGFALLGRVVEDVTGLTLADYMDQNIFAPLGMNQSLLNYSVSPSLDYAKAYVTGDSWTALPFDANTPLLAPAGSVMTTAKDMAAYMRFLLSDDPVALALRSVQSQNHPKASAIALGIWQKQREDVRLLNHTGAFSNYTSYFAVSPETGRGAFLVTAGRPSSGPGFAAYGEGATLIDDYVSGITAPSVTPEPLANAQDFAGQYVVSRRFYKGVGKFLSLQNLMHVHADQAGYLFINGDGPYGAISEGVLAKAGPTPKFYGYELNASEPRLTMNADTARKATFFEKPEVGRVFVLAGIVLVLLGAIWASIAKPRRPLVLWLTFAATAGLAAALLTSNVFGALIEGRVLEARIITGLAWSILLLTVWHLTRFSDDRRGPWTTGMMGLALLGVFLLTSGLANPALT